MLIPGAATTGGVIMAHAQYTVTVQRPVDDVFAYLVDGANNRRWRDGVLEIERVSGDGGVGTTYRQVLKGPGGRRIDGDYRVTAYERPSLLAFEVVAGPVRPVGRYELAAVGAQATAVTFRLDVRIKGIMKVVSPLVGKQMQSEVAHLVDLKRDMESGG
jgi:uncharacterized protein YndB with AHSA1/START domain